MAPKIQIRRMVPRRSCAFCCRPRPAPECLENKLEMSRNEMSANVVIEVPHDRPAGGPDTYIRLSQLGVYQLCWRPNAIAYSETAISIPRCHKCKIRHERIIAITAGHEDDRESSEGDSQ